MKNYRLAALLYLIFLSAILLSACVSATSVPTAMPVNTADSTTATQTDTPSTATQTITPTISSADGEVSFSNAVLPILQANCTRCHGTSRQSAELKLNTYENLMAGSENGPVVVPGDSAGSLLVDMISSGEMPKRGDKLTADEIQTISDWINAGAPNN